MWFCIFVCICVNPFASLWLLASPGVRMVRSHFVCVRGTRTWELPRSFRLGENTHTFRETECRGGVPSILLLVISGLSSIDYCQKHCVTGVSALWVLPLATCTVAGTFPIPHQRFVCTCHSFPGPAACWAEISTATVHYCQQFVLLKLSLPWAAAVFISLHCLVTTYVSTVAGFNDIL